MTASRASRKCSRVLVVEAHPITARGLSEALEDGNGFTVVATAGTEAGAIRAAQEHRPDVAIVDLTLKRGTGLGLIRSLSAEHPNIRILVFTIHDETLYAERAMRAGAHGYLNKSASADELISAVHAVASGELALSDSMNARLVQKAIGKEAESDGVRSLSDRELEVFELIGRGTALKLIGEQLGISVKTVESHRENIKRKLGIGSAPELNRFAVAWVENPG